MTNNATENTINISDRWFGIILVIGLIFGNALGIGKVAGVTLTLYRIIVPAFFIMFILIKKKQSVFFTNNTNKYFSAFMIAWIVYGGVLTLVSNYVVFSNAIKELLALALGGISVICIVEFCETKKHFYFLLKCVKIAIFISIVFSLIEIMIGIHLYTSTLYFEIKKDTFWSILFELVSQKKIYPSTVFFYGTNDYSAFLAIFSPLFWPDKEKTTKENIINSSSFLLIIFILSVNDANISWLGLTIAICVGCVVARMSWRLGLLGVTSIVIRQWLINKIITVLLLVKSLFPQKVYESVENTETVVDMANEALEMVASSSQVIQAQVQTAANKSGSLYARWLAMLDSFDICRGTYLLGSGPASYTNYLRTKGARGILVNPHNYWLEILSQYGIFIFLSYIVFIIILFFKLIFGYFKNGKYIYLQVSGMIISWVIASVAPSSFIGYSYYWIILAFALILTNNDK